ncbi:unnamed protein product [Lasius platythorax]|uniref:Secreted protein n=1 Tax=Lasius platythorax TaxID=488582 RepID=A0AAV2P9S9_9HYME
MKIAHCLIALIVAISRRRKSVTERKTAAMFFFHVASGKLVANSRWRTDGRGERTPCRRKDEGSLKIFSEFQSALELNDAISTRWRTRLSDRRRRRSISGNLELGWDRS